MAVRIVTGFEQPETSSGGSQGSATNFDGLYESIQGSAGEVTYDAAIFRTGTYALKTTRAVAGAAGVIIPLRTALGDTGRAASGISVGRVYVYVGTLPSSATYRSFLTLSSGADSISLQVNNAGATRWLVTDGADTTHNLNYALGTGAWVMLEWSVEHAGGNVNIETRWDGEVDTSISRSATATTFQNLFLGINTSGTIYYDDLIVGDEISDQWYGPGYCIGLLPDSDGTHSPDASAFMDGNTGLPFASGDTTIHTLVDELSPFDATAPRAGSHDAAAYLEFGFADTAITDPIQAVRLINANKAFAATLHRNRVKVNDNGTIIQPASLFDQNDGTTTTKYRCGNAMVTAPSTGLAWTLTRLNALLVRWGYHESFAPGSPPPAVDHRCYGLMLEVAFSTPLTSDGVPHLLMLTGAGIA